MAKKYRKDVKVELREFRVPHKSIVDETVLLQYHVTATAADGTKENIGYCETGPSCKLAPLAQAQFPPELYPAVEKQIAEIKATWLESTRTDSLSEDPRKDC